MGRIPQRFIDDLIARVDIVDVIDGYVPLKRRGKEYWACCPFHNENSPSFSVSPDKQFYHCFGCGAHGTVIGFLMEYDRMEFVEAVETLAASVGLEVPREGGVSAPAPDQDLYTLLDSCAAWYRGQLREHAVAIEYLKARGLGGETAKAYGVGYAPGGWDRLLQGLGGEAGARERLLRAGMLTRSESDRVYDRFRDRIMFPIRDRRGRVVGFGGRVLAGDEGPKYLNSPETEVFHKGREVYGLFEARQREQRPARLIVVEGYMDVLGLAEQGVHGAVATLGTSISTEQVQGLFRVTGELVYCFDGDAAGRRAARRALEATLPALRSDRRCRFLFLPEGEDPDSFVRSRGPEAFAEALGEAQPLSEFLLAELRDSGDVDSVEGRAQIIDAAGPLLRRIETDSLRLQLTEAVARLTRSSLDRVAPVIGGRRPAESPPAPAASVPSLRWTPLRRAINVLLTQPSLASEERRRALPDPSTLPGLPLLAQVIDIALENPHLNPAAILERFRGSEHERHLSRLAEESPPGDAELYGDILDDCLRSLQRNADERRMDELLGKSDLTAEEKREYQTLLARRSARGSGAPAVWQQGGD